MVTVAIDRKVMAGPSPPGRPISERAKEIEIEATHRRLAAGPAVATAVDHRQARAVHGGQPILHGRRA
jgi:hypothetical protein